MGTKGYSKANLITCFVSQGKVLFLRRMVIFSGAPKEGLCRSSIMNDSLMLLGHALLYASAMGVGGACGIKLKNISFQYLQPAELHHTTGTQ